MFLPAAEEVGPKVPNSVLQLPLNLNPVTWNFIRKMSVFPALLCPSRELVVSPATQASLPVGSTCVKWSAGHCCAAQMRMETEGNMIRNPPQPGKSMKEWHGTIKHTKSTIACPTVTGRKREMKSKIMIIDDYSISLYPLGQPVSIFKSL